MRGAGGKGGGKCGGDGAARWRDGDEAEGVGAQIQGRDEPVAVDRWTDTRKSKKNKNIIFEKF